MKIELNENQIERFYKVLIKIFEEKYNVSINYKIKNQKEKKAK